jgi:hypothetical protein
MDVRNEGDETSRRHNNFVFSIKKTCFYSSMEETVLDDNILITLDDFQTIKIHFNPSFEIQYGLQKHYIIIYSIWLILFMLIRFWYL